MSRARREELERLHHAIVETKRELETDLERTGTFQAALARAGALQSEASVLAFERARIDRQTSAILEKIILSRRDGFGRSPDDSIYGATVFAAFLFSAPMTLFPAASMFLLAPATVLAAWLSARNRVP